MALKNVRAHLELRIKELFAGLHIQTILTNFYLPIFYQ